MSTDVIQTGAYEARFRLHVRDYVLIPLCLALVAFGIWGSFERPFRAIPLILIGASYLVTRFITACKGAVAIRIDDQGFRLGRYPVPWSDITAVVLWSRRSGLSVTQYVGLDRGKRPPLDEAAAEDYDTLAEAPQHVATNVVMDSIPVSMWKLDEQAFADALRRFAPRIPLVRA